jgi:hypothetical protein
LITGKFMTVRSTVFIAAVFVGQSSCRAEKLMLDPFTPNIMIYKVQLKPDVTIAADVTTTRFAVHPVAQLDIAYDVTKLTNDALAISGNALPVTVQGGPCQFTIQNLSSLNLSVTGNTGIIIATADVNIANCPLSSGKVTVSAHFVPMAASTQLSLKVFGLQVQVPWTWNLAGAIAGQSPQKLIETQIEKVAANAVLTVPKIDNVQAAFQGASLNSKNNLVIVTILADALVNKQAITNALIKWNAFQELSIVFPKE